VFNGNFSAVAGLCFAFMPPQKLSLRLEIVVNVVDQNPCDLVLGISNRELNCSLTVLAKETIYSDPLAFTFHVLGESHLVSIQRNGSVVWQELFSCRKLPQQGLLHHRHFTRMDEHSWQHDNYGIKVTFSAEPRHTPATHNYLQVAFPDMYGQMPYTRVQWEQRPSGIRWQTVHTYPNPAGVTYVTTESIFYAK
jgi:hypothetical protein